MAGFGLIILACAFWAIDTLIRYPLMQNGLNAVSLVFYEHLLLTFIFSIVFFKSLKKVWEAKTSHYFYFFMVGGIGSALATVAFSRAFMFLNPSLVILLQKFQPLVVILLARVVLREQIKKAFIFWVIVCLAGALLISFEDIMKLNMSSKGWWDNVFAPSAIQGYILVFFSIFGWGAATVYGKKLGTEGYTNEQIMAGRFILGFLCLLPFALKTPNLFGESVEVYGKISLMVLVSGLLAMYVFYQGLRKVSARACSLAEMFFPFMAVIVNWLFLGAALSPIQLIGGGVLLLGSVVIQLKHY
jgi:drug/metabolite transporter (DMT)-like permease